MPYICAARSDIPDGTIQVPDLLPNVSQAVPAISPAGQNCYVNRTQNDPLAAKVRSILRRHYGWSRNSKRHYAVPCVYSLEQLRYPTLDGGVSCEKSWEDGPRRLDCESGFGACMTVTATFALVAVSRVLEKLAKPKPSGDAAAH